MDPELEDWLQKDRHATRVVWASLIAASVILGAAFYLRAAATLILALAAVCMGIAYVAGFWVARARGFPWLLGAFGFFVVLALPNRRVIEARVAAEIAARASKGGAGEPTKSPSPYRGP